MRDGSKHIRKSIALFCGGSCIVLSHTSRFHQRGQEVGVHCAVAVSGQYISGRNLVRSSVCVCDGPTCLLDQQSARTDVPRVQVQLPEALFAHRPRTNDTTEVRTASSVCIGSSHFVLLQKAVPLLPRSAQRCHSCDTSDCPAPHRLSVECLLENECHMPHAHDSE